MQKKPNPVDVYVGGRLREVRVTTGLSQQQLGEELGLSYQQIQKYETGANRLSASRIVQCAEQLGVSPCYFFEEMPADLSGLKPNERRRLNLLEANRGVHLPSVFRDFNSIQNPEIRAAVRGILKVCSQAR